jgi:hypothetical protein
MQVTILKNGRQYPSHPVYIAHRHINLEIETEAKQFPEKEFIMGFSLQCIHYTIPTICHTEVIHLHKEMRRKAMKISEHFSDGIFFYCNNHFIHNALPLTLAYVLCPPPSPSRHLSLLRLSFPLLQIQPSFP